MAKGKRLKRRFGKDNDRPIYQKWDKTGKYVENYDKIDWSKKDENKKED